MIRLGGISGTECPGKLSPRWPVLGQLFHSLPPSAGVLGQGPWVLARSGAFLQVLQNWIQKIRTILVEFSASVPCSDKSKETKFYREKRFIYFTSLAVPRQEQVAPLLWFLIRMAVVDHGMPGSWENGWPWLRLPEPSGENTLPRKHPQWTKDLPLGHDWISSTWGFKSHMNFVVNLAQTIASGWLVSQTIVCPRVTPISATHLPTSALTCWLEKKI